MDEGLVVLLLGFLFVIFVMPIMAFVRAGRALKEGRALEQRILELELKLERGERPPRREPKPAVEPTPEPVIETPAEPVAETPAEPVAETPAEPAVEPTPAPTPEPPSAPPPTPALVAPPPPASGFSFERMKGTLSWEEFMGAKLYGWIGGLSLFLAVAYFVKHSFDRGWLPPVVRVSMGFLLGLGLIVSGVVLRQKKYTALSHTLAATGVLILYVVTFACRGIYHFPFFGPGATFAFMALITATAFILAVRLEAMAVAVLGMLGGFATPVLISTGRDAPVALFTYIGLLDIGLIAVALVRKWRFLSPLAMVGTVLMQFGWMSKFFRREAYYADNNVLVPMAVLVAFNLLWLGATRITRDREDDRPWFSGAAMWLALTSFLAAFYFQTFTSIAERPFILLGFVFVLDLLVFVLVRLDRERRILSPLAGALVFVFLSLWMGTRVTDELLPAALLFTLVFALAHTAVPLAIARIDGETHRPPVWLMLFPPLALGALLIPVFRLAELTIWIWPVIFLVDLLAIALAAFTLSLLPVLLTLFLTLLAASALVFKLTSTFIGLSSLMLILGVTAALFVAAGLWLRGRLSDLPSGEAKAKSEAFARQLPAFAAVLPFVLLVVIVGRLELSDPSPVFGLALLLVFMMLSVSRMLNLAWLPLIGLASVVALEHVWQLSVTTEEHQTLVLLWYGVFFAAFALYPFLFHRDLSSSSGPWIASALVGPAQFYRVHQLVRETWPATPMGILGVIFALPSVASLVTVLRRTPEDAKARETQLALYGGVALFFVTLIFPLQFSRQWITISWAIEGAALCWLFLRVPHRGLRLVGLGLLLTAFVRLALNPEVFRYHVRTELPILNWYLYAYSTVIASLAMAARWLAPPNDRLFGRSVPGILHGLAVILAFILLNIQIADFFTEPGSTVLTFEFSGNFARDMSYSIAWGVFALGLLIVGIVRSIPAARYAALGLLGVTMLKLFFHDLAELDALYRVGALVSLSVVALAASFLYQKFSRAQAGAHEAENKNPTEP